MKQHLKLLACLEQISPILALRTIFQWEVPSLDVDDGTTVSEGEEGIRHLEDAEGEQLLTATTDGDDLKITLHAPLLTQPEHPLNRLLQILGVNKNPMRMKAEAFYDRVLTADSAWTLLRSLSGVPDSERIDAAGMLIATAAEWHTLRMATFECRATPAQTRRIEALEQQVKNPQWLVAGIERITLNGEPRGSAMTVHLNGRSWATEIPVMAFNWTVAPALAVTKAPAMVTKGRSVMGVDSAASMLPRATRINDEVLDVLANVAVTGNEVRIVERLKPGLYRKVGEVLVELGGQWSTAKQAHVFGVCPQQAISDVVSTGELLMTADYEFFPTPPELVAKLLLLTGLEPGMKVLEPQAGSGAIAMAAAEVVGKDNVTCFELMPRFAAHLRGLGFNINGTSDFLQVQPQPVFDRILLNPPFSGGKDMAHIEHAMKFLKPGGRLGAIASQTWQTADNGKSRAFRQWVEDHAIGVQQIERGAFKASGTDVPTVMLVLKAQQPATVQAEQPGTGQSDENIMKELAAAFF